MIGELPVQTLKETLTYAVFPNPDYRDNQFFTVNGNELVSIALSTLMRLLSFDSCDGNR